MRERFDCVFSCPWPTLLYSTAPLPKLERLLLGQPLLLPRLLLPLLRQAVSLALPAVWVGAVVRRAVQASAPA